MPTPPLAGAIFDAPPQSPTDSTFSESSTQSSPYLTVNPPPRHTDSLHSKYDDDHPLATPTQRSYFVQLNSIFEETAKGAANATRRGSLPFRRGEACTEHQNQSKILTLSLQLRRMSYTPSRAVDAARSRERHLRPATAHGLDTSYLSRFATAAFRVHICRTSPVFPLL